MLAPPPPLLSPFPAFTTGAMLGRAHPSHPPFPYPPFIYWTYPSPPVSPPHPHTALVILQSDANFLHSVAEVLSGVGSFLQKSFSNSVLAKIGFVPQQHCTIYRVFTISMANSRE